MDGGGAVLVATAAAGSSGPTSHSGVTTTGVGRAGLGREGWKAGEG